MEHIVSYFVLQDGNQEKKRRESTASSSCSTASQPSPKPTTPKAEPASTFDLLSGLISKTESKSVPTTPQDPARDDPLQMLAGLMKSVKAESSVKTETNVKTEANVTTAANVKTEPKAELQSPSKVVKSEPVEVKKEPTDTAVKVIGTLGG